MRRYWLSAYNTFVDIRRFISIRKLHIKFLSMQVPDVVIEFLSFGGMLGYLMKKSNKVPYILIYDAPLDEQYLEVYKRKSLFYGMIKKRELITVKNADSVICYSRPVVEFLVKKYGISVEKCSVLPTLSFRHLTGKNEQKNHGGTIIGFIGSFLSYHRTELLVTVFEKLCPQHPNLKLYLVGYGECWHEVKLLVDGSPFASRICMTGYLPDEKMEEIKQQFDIGVIPFYNWYGSPMKLFEYAALAIPIVAPGTPTISDIFEHGKEALLFSVRQPEESLFDNLKLLIGDPALRKRLGQNAYETLQTKYSREVYRNIFMHNILSVLK